MSETISYTEAEEIARVILKSISNLSKYCRDNKGVSYKYARQIKINKTEAEYPNLVKKLLELNGYNVSIKKEYFFKLNK